MNRIRPHSAGFALGILLGLVHAVWAALVWAGGAQAVALILVTAIIGYLLGWIGAVIWNRYGAGATP